MDQRQALTTQKPPPSNSSREGDRAVAAAIARLLLHYWTPQDLSEGSRAAMAADWLDDLREFGGEVVMEACGRWRRSESKRPTIAEIRRFCIEEANSRRSVELDALPAPEQRARQAESRRSQHSDDQREGRDRINDWARNKGYTDVDAYIAAKGIHWSEAYRECIREIMAGSAIAEGMNRVLQDAAALGVKAREYTPEEMAAARRQIGIEEETT